MKFKITTLVDNTVGIGGSRELIGEHGLAFLIETGMQSILFDTGQYLALENNSRILGKDLSAIDTVVRRHRGGHIPKHLNCAQAIALSHRYDRNDHG